MRYKIAIIAALLPSYTYSQPVHHASASMDLLEIMATGNDGFDKKTNAQTPTIHSQNPTQFIAPIPPQALAEHISEKGVTNALTLLVLKEFGKEPDTTEKAKIKKALKVLNDTKVGKELCKTIGKSGCTWKDFESAGIEITTRDLQYHLPEPLESMLGYFLGSGDPTAAVPPPSYINGRTILCLDKGLLSQSPSYISTYIHHELSHIADIRTLGESTPGTVTKYATEYKAVSLQMMLYDELLRTGKLNGDGTDGIQFILSVYRWLNGGPKPDRAYSITIDGKSYSASEIIGTYVEPGDIGLKAVWRLIRFYYGFPEGTVDEKGLKYLQGIRGNMKDFDSKYQSWFPSNSPQTPPVTPQQPQQPPNNNNGNNNGGGNSDGGEWHPPYIPNPNFPPGT